MKEFLKRPMLLFAAAFILGIYFYTNKTVVGMVLLLFAAVLTFMIAFPKYRKSITDNKLTFVLLPFLFMAGFLVTIHQDSSTAIERELQGESLASLMAKVESVSKTEYGYQAVVVKAIITVDGITSAEASATDESMSEDSGAEETEAKETGTKETGTKETGTKETGTEDAGTKEKGEDTTSERTETLIEKTYRYDVGEIRKVIVYTDTPVLPGNSIYAVGNVELPEQEKNPGQFDKAGYYRAKNITCIMKAETLIITDSKVNAVQSVLLPIRERLCDIYTSILPEKEAGIMEAILLGEKAFLDQSIVNLYQKSGIAHILAISGLHISLLGMSLYRLLRKIKSPLITACLLTILLVISYGLLTEMGVSTKRAVIMLILSVLAKLTGRTYDMLSAAAFTAIILLAGSPLQLYQAGFLLSFSAVAGVGILMKAIRLFNPYDKATLRSKVVDGLLGSLSIQLMTLPVILYFYFETPLYATVLNLFVIPLLSLIVLLGLAAGVLGMVSLSAASFAIGGAYYILKFYEGICSIARKLPLSTILIGRPAMHQIVLYYGILICFVFFAGRRGPAGKGTEGKRMLSRKMVAGVTLFLLLLSLHKGSTDSLLVTFLSVGQGDAACIQSPAGYVYLIDGGSSDSKDVGSYRLEPFLKSKGINKVEAVFISHADSDHFNGIVELIEKMPDTAAGTLADTNRITSDQGIIQIKTLVLSVTDFIDENYRMLVELAEQKGILVRYVEQGDKIDDGAITFTCLHPEKTYQAASANAYSEVLLMTYKNFDVLFTGDVQADGEKSSVTFYQDLAEYDSSYNENVIEVIKVSHHGSKTSSTQAFLSFFHPMFSIISCGENNSYGHPHEETLQRLKEIGSSILILNQSGAVTIKTDGECMSLENYVQDPLR